MSTSVRPEPIDEGAFQRWYAGWARKAGLDPDPDNPLHKYDYRAAFRAGAVPQIDAGDGLYHWPSEFKADDHPNRYVRGVDTKSLDAHGGNAPPTKPKSFLGLPFIPQDIKEKYGLRAFRPMPREASAEMRHQWDEYKRWEEAQRIDPTLLAKARLKIAEARKRGFSDADIDAYLQSEIGASLADVVKPNGQDFWRSVGSGVTLGFGDELAGLMSKMGGGSYRHARDAAREESAGFSAVRPKTGLLTEVVAGGIPAMLTTPVFGPAGAAGKMAQAGAAGAATGAVAGAGHSEGETAGDVAKDAGKSAIISAALGSLLSAGGSVAKAAGSRVMDAVKPGRAVVREAATQLPANAGQTVARQEALAPGTAVLADVSPEMQALTRGVGADAKAGVAARTAAESRVSSLRGAKEAMGPKYELLNKVLPVDDELKAALAEAGRKNALKAGATEVEFTTIQQIRSRLKAEARASRNDAVKREKNQAAAKLTNWLKGHEPDIEQLDRDFAFLMDRIKAANATAREITGSSKNYAASRAYGSEAGSIGGSLPQGSRGMLDVLSAITRPNRAARARAANELLLTPGDATKVSLRRIQEARKAMDAPEGSIPPMLRSLLFGDAVPNAGLLGNQ